MSVLDLIKVLLDCPMNATVSFVSEVTSPLQSSETFHVDIEIGAKTSNSSRYVELFG